MKRFLSLLITFPLGAIPMMSFISSSSYIYVNQFGLSEQVFSYFFAANALFMVMGLMFTGVTLVSLILWLIFSKKPYVRQVPKLVAADTPSKNS